MDFFGTLRKIYLKGSFTDGEISELNRPLLITLSKWLSYDKDNLQSLKDIQDYIFIDKNIYFYLLYFKIPRKKAVPFLRKYERVKEKEDKLLNKIKYVLDWSNRELKLHIDIIDKLILSNKKYWKKELGVK